MPTLWDAQLGRRVNCDIGRLAEVDFKIIRDSWTKEFQRRHAAGFRDDDALLWERGFLSDAGFSADSVAPGYVVHVSGEVQGIVVIELEPRASRTQSNAGVTYISYLASAPWNRRDERLRGHRFHGTGRLLVLLAITESVDMGCQGHVGLHSFPVAAAFYVRLGFQHLGVDPAQRGMPYFELAAESAQKILDEARRQKC